MAKVRREENWLQEGERRFQFLVVNRTGKVSISLHCWSKWLAKGTRGTVLISCHFRSSTKAQALHLTLLKKSAISLPFYRTWDFYPHQKYWWRNSNIFVRIFFSFSRFNWVVLMAWFFHRLFVERNFRADIDDGNKEIFALINHNGCCWQFRSKKGSNKSTNFRENKNLIRA